ncbi:MAG: type II toxin-antitoxin system PemK/MazF family toxin [Brachybacterium sp.]|nr:type II toxin-antitoxin system PemK/MazF family toxin [Brachybacterium sp.]
MSITSQLTRLLRSVVRSPATRRAVRDLVGGASRSTTSRRHPGNAAPPDGRSALADRPSLPPVVMSYDPVDDGRADPGEVVWAWVPFEEDITRGKDRPVLVLAREDARRGGTDGAGEVLVGLMATSRDGGAGTYTDERGATWVDIGSGAWDAQGRPSEVRVDRLLRIPVDAVRRDGAALDAARFAEVASAVRGAHRWDRA